MKQFNFKLMTALATVFMTGFASCDDGGEEEDAVLTGQVFITPAGPVASFRGTTRLVSFGVTALMASLRSNPEIATLNGKNVINYRLISDPCTIR